jgi:hypothetical protein
VCLEANLRKFLFAFLLVASPAFAQDQAAEARVAAGCGPASVEFSVKTNKAQHPAPQPESGKALVYILEEVKTDDLGFKIGGVTMRLGLDGSWIGATSSQSYLFFPVDPGDHHLCANWQSSLGSRSKLGSALSLTAEAGKVYFFRAKVYAITDRDHPLGMKLEAIDPAEAQFLISSFALSTSHPKK